LTALLAASASASGQQAEMHRAALQRDQMTAEFAAQLHGAPLAPLQALHARQLRETQAPLSSDPALADQLLPYRDARMAREREGLHVLRFAPPVLRSELARPLALPGGRSSGVDPVAPHRLGR
jgi:hypothetical protein